MARHKVYERSEETPLVERAVKPPTAEVSSTSDITTAFRNGGRHTKQAYKPYINQNMLLPKAITAHHQDRNDSNRNAQVRLKFPSANQVPNLMRTQLRIAVTRAEHDGDGAAHSNHNTQRVPLPEWLLQHERSDYAVGDEGDDAERGDDGGRREAVGEEVSCLADCHEDDADPPVGRPEVGLLLVGLLFQPRICALVALQRRSCMWLRNERVGFSTLR